MTTRLMRGALILPFLLAPVEAQWKVIGYYHTPTSALPPSAIRFDRITHLNHSFVYPDAEGTLLTDPGVPNRDLVDAAHGAGVKILVALGGASASDFFPTVVSDSTVGRTYSYRRSQNADGCKENIAEKIC